MCYTHVSWPTLASRSSPIGPVARQYTVVPTSSRTVDRGSLQAAAEHVELGLPVPRRVRFRTVKRLIARLGWFLARRQIDFNVVALAELTALHDGMTQLHVDMTELRAQIGDVQTHQDKLSVKTDLIQRQAFVQHEEGLSLVRAEMVDLVSNLDDLRAQMVRETTQARIRQAQIDLFLDRVRQTLPAEPDPTTLARLPDSVDSLYVSFEALFRGSPDLIRTRAEPFVDDVLKIDRSLPLLDIGCGRGEWLQLLKEHQIDAYGIDLNEHYVRSCKEAGLDVRHEDARFHLAELAPGSLAAVTAFHIFEHLEIPELIEVIDLAIRGLAPSGLLLLETPNPDCLPVGASSFYQDPTHTRPLNPHFLAFLLEARGLANIEVRYEHRAADSINPPEETTPWAADIRPVVDLINKWLVGPMDYAVLGRRA